MLVPIGSDGVEEAASALCRLIDASTTSGAVTSEAVASPSVCCAGFGLKKLVIIVGAKTQDDGGTEPGESPAKAQVRSTVRVGPSKYDDKWSLGEY